MNVSATFAMIKPHAVEASQIGEIICMIEKAGFKVVELMLTDVDYDTAAEFYEIHKKKPFYDQLCKGLSSGPVVVMVLEHKGDDAVALFRTVLGDTDPSKAKPNTIRAKFGKSIDLNAVHGSDSDDNAAIETDFFFGFVE